MKNKGLAASLILGVVFGLVLIFLSGCVGPSKARYKVLLH